MTDPSSPMPPAPAMAASARGAAPDARLLADLTARMRESARRLERQFLGKEEIVRWMHVAALAGEHMLMIGPPGTAKSALVRAFAASIEARAFDYLLTRFTEPNEIFGPVDIQAFREGRYVRRIDGMLPTCEIAFLDEIFKANSAILNSLLTLLNARRFTHGNVTVDVPLVTLFAASNEVPTDDALSALFDRFALRVKVDYLDSYHFRGLLERGLELEAAELDKAPPSPPLLRSGELRAAQRQLAAMLKALPEDFLATYKGLVFQIRSEGVGLSDRRAVKLLKLFVASAAFDGRVQVDDSDFALLRHVWNTPEQEDILAEVVGPVVDRWYERHPDQRRMGATPARLDDLLEELRIIRETLGSSEALSDVQLFSQLRNLGDIKAALARMRGNATAERMIGEVDRLLETLFASSRFG